MESSPPSSLHSKSLHRLNKTVFTRGDALERLPGPDEEFDDVVNATGVPLVFKRHALTQFARLLDCHHALMFRRPPGWGLNFFASMVSATFDRDYDHKDDPFQVLVGEEWDRHLHRHFVLDLDFTRLPCVADFHTEFHAYLKKECRDLVSRYRLEKQIGSPSLYRVPQEKPEKYISLLAMALRHVSYDPLLVIVRNFDVPTFNYPRGRAALNQFLNVLEEKVTTKIVGSLFLLSNYDDGTVYSCMGRNPLAMIRKVPSLPPLDLPRTLDLTHNLAFQTAVGFTRPEIDALDDAFSHLEAQDARRVLDMMDEDYGRRSVFSDRLARKHQCPPDPVKEAWHYREEDPLAGLDTSKAFEGIYGAQLIMKVLARKYGFPNIYGRL
ncbi:AAA-ATPase-like domain-containing protein [Mycena indigotica]|uniref:AAA-ATPase-like domain-containing protein n=1 Tax=Mycena indigotica TaxID=2126181 RepID=A0A8H6WHJ3_9AGAR|nr:AAA-ATPase-like domain-containing protein [Mycena indigotica]KAF7312534.1 AAA-ATPase-like domain-containing protein [Mycena indigotica]